MSVSCEGTKVALIDKYGGLSVVVLKTRTVASICRNVIAACFNEDHDEVPHYHQVPREGGIWFPLKCARVTCSRLVPYHIW